MPGVHVIIRDEKFKQSISAVNFHEFLLENYYNVKTFSKTPEHLLAISYYDGYPFLFWENENVQIVLEGMIYNRSDDDSKRKLNEIARCFSDGEHYDMPKRFVDSSDGEYVVVMLDKKKEKILIFNDYLGCLPIYYYCCDGLCVVSSEIKSILQVIPEIKLNKVGLVEFLMSQYTFGDKTIFENIFCLDHAQILVIDAGTGEIRFKKSNTADFNCILTDLFSSQEESIDCLREALCESVNNRVTACQKRGYKIIADLSGGYDTRTVLGVLSKFTKDVSYFTCEYVQDESTCARAMFSAMDSPGRYCKLSFDNVLDFENIGQLVYKTDGLVNFWTTSVCYGDAQYLRSKVPEVSVRFSAIGGSDFMRKLSKPYHRSLLYGFETGIYSAFTLHDACKMVGLDSDEYRDTLKAYFDTWPERTPQDQIKRYYFEYIRKLYMIAAGHRERIHFWNVQPMWGLDFMRAIFSRFPLDWTGYTYYVKFMESIDPRLLKVPIFKSFIHLDSKDSVEKQEIIFRNSKEILQKKLGSIKTVIRARTPFFYEAYKSLQARKMAWNGLKEGSLNTLNAYYNKLNFTRDIFNLPMLKKYTLLCNDMVYKRMLTLFIYLQEIEKRHKCHDYRQNQGVAQKKDP
jgi:hypothetical protein